jgi:hypothetical protein
LSTDYVLNRDSWWQHARRAWPDLRHAWPTPELRGLAFIAAMTFLAVIIIDIVAGMLKYKGLVAPDTAHFLRISEQGSLGEFCGYIAMEMAVIFVFLTAVSLQSVLHMLVAVLLQYVMLDDMLMVHETAGAAIAKRFITGPTAFPPDALGELMFGVFFCTGVVAVSVLAARTSTPYLRSLCALLFAPIILLAFCAVGVDFLHAQVPRDAKYLDGVVALLEDGGELFSIFALMLVAAAQWIALPWLSPPDQQGLNPP